jgi:hypothetical protein
LNNYLTLKSKRAELLSPVGAVADLLFSNIEADVLVGKADADANQVHCDPK